MKGAGLPSGRTISHGPLPPSSPAPPPSPSPSASSPVLLCAFGIGMAGDVIGERAFQRRREK